MNNILGQVIATHNLKQFHFLAETEKCAHVTYFFNGGLEEPFAGKINGHESNGSDMIKHQRNVSRSSDERYCDRGDQKRMHSLVVINYANPDMVDFGQIPETVEAIETVDVWDVCSKALAVGGTALITADHGNARI